MKNTATPLVIALSLAFGASLAQAQAAVIDGTSNTLLLAERPVIPAIGAGNNLRQIGLPAGPAVANLTARANLSGSLTQASDASQAVASRQVASIGSANGVTGATGTLLAQGTVTRSVAQVRSGGIASNSNATQSITVGGLAGAITASSVQASGTAATDLQQNAQDSSRGVGNQTIDVGGVSDSGGGNLVATGTITGSGIFQRTLGPVGQELRVGSISGSNVQSAKANGTVTAGISQFAGNNVGPNTEVQRVGVGDIREAQVASVTTQGLLSGPATQSQDGFQSVRQVVEIASVSRTDAAGTIKTEGTVAAAVTQTAQAGQAALPGRQQLLVGAVVGGAPVQADTRATLAGTVNQIIGAGGGEQRIVVGAVEGASGRVSTDATVDASLTQILSGSGLNRDQVISIAGAEQTRGDVTTRAVVTGAVGQSSQANQASSQRIHIGSAVNTGAAVVVTDVTVTGNVSQSAISTSREVQRILIGSVVGN